MTEPTTRDSEAGTVGPVRAIPDDPGPGRDQPPADIPGSRQGDSEPAAPEPESGSAGGETTSVNPIVSAAVATEHSTEDAGTEATGRSEDGARIGRITDAVSSAEPRDSRLPRTPFPPAGEEAMSEAGAAPAAERPRALVLRVPRLRRPSIPVSVAVLAVAAAVVFAGLWRTDGAELSDLHADLAGDRRAEEVAGDYALRVSRVEHIDLEAWRRALQNGVSAELAPKLSAAVDVVGPWLAQMEYRATGTLLASEVTARAGDTYTVAAFVEMRSTSRQTPTGVTATAAYTVTLNRAADWIITDVGGSGLAPAGGATAPESPRPPTAPPPR